MHARSDLGTGIRGADCQAHSLEDRQILKIVPEICNVLPRALIFRKKRFNALGFIADSHEAIRDGEILRPLLDRSGDEPRNEGNGNRLTLKPFDRCPISDVECFTVRAPFDGVIKAAIGKDPVDIGSHEFNLTGTSFDVHGVHLRKDLGQNNKMSSFIPLEDARRLLAQNALVVDVRTEAEWLAGHGPEPILHCPLDQLIENPHLVPSDRPLLLCCRSGGRSGTAQMFLAQQGFKEVYNLGPWERDPRVI